MSNQTTKSKFDSTMNKIVKDCIIVSSIIILGLLIYGTSKVHGDLNAVGMYGPFIIPLILMVLLGLGMIQICKMYLKAKMKWFSFQIPMALLVFTIWLKPTEAYIFTAVLIFIVLFSFIKCLIQYLF